MFKIINIHEISRSSWIFVFIYFENCPFLPHFHIFHTKMGLDVYHIWSSSTYPWIIALPTSCRHIHILSKSSYPYTSPFPHFYRQTPNHVHPYAQMPKPSQSATSRHLNHHHHYYYYYYMFTLRCSNHLNLPCLATSIIIIIHDHEY